MKVCCSSVLISAVLWSLCLVTYIPVALMNAATWKERSLKLPCNGSMFNFYTLLGFAVLGIVSIGLIVLRTGYIKKERWAWLIMLIIFLCFFFPSDVLPVFLRMPGESSGWSVLPDLLRTARQEGSWRCGLWALSPASEAVSIGCAAAAMLLGFIRFLVMLVALVIPVKAFFWRRAKG